MTDCFGKRADEAEAPPEGAVRPGVKESAKNFMPTAASTRICRNRVFCQFWRPKRFMPFQSLVINITILVSPIRIWDFFHRLPLGKKPARQGATGFFHP